MPYVAKITTVGLQKFAAAQASGVNLVFASIAVGDGNGSPITPASEMTALTNEVWRGTPNRVFITSSAPRTVIVEGIIPAAHGGYTIREVGVFNLAGDLIAVASHAPVDKPEPADGMTVEAIVQLQIEYTADTEDVEVTVDGSVVTATREYVDDATAGGLYLWESFS